MAYATSDVPTTRRHEVCGTPYTVDTGTGYGDVLQDCVYEVYAPRCTFETMQWVIVDTLVQAAGLCARMATPGGCTGSRGGQPQRALYVRCERGWCAAQLALTADTYALCVPQSRWKVAVNGLGAVVEATPVGTQ